MRDFPKVFPTRVMKARMVRCAYGGHLFDESKSTSGSALFCNAEHHLAYVKKFGDGPIVLREDIQ